MRARREGGERAGDGGLAVAAELPLVGTYLHGGTSYLVFLLVGMSETLNGMLNTASISLAHVDRTAGGLGLVATMAYGMVSGLGARRAIRAAARLNSSESM